MDWENFLEGGAAPLEPREQREQSQACLNSAESRSRKTKGQSMINLAEIYDKRILRHKTDSRQTQDRHKTDLRQNNK